MAKDQIRYDLHVQDALRGVVRKVLSEVARDGLPGDHHFYISFRTNHPGVRLSNRMREKYPDDMTIVLQHQFWDLAVNEHAFEVGLSFSGVPERLSVPFEAVTGFFDPSVDFGLKFEMEAERAESGDVAPAAPAPRSAEPAPAAQAPAGANRSAAKPGAEGAMAPAERKPAAKFAKAADQDGAEDGTAGAEVVSLDAFRKKT